MTAAAGRSGRFKRPDRPVAAGRLAL